MLTDDDLTRELGDAFRGATDDLRYAGRVPTPRTGAALGVPLVASAATVAALAGVWAAAPDDGAEAPPSAGPTGTPSGTPRDTPSGTAAPGPRLVTETVEVAGYTFTYRHAAGDGPADDLYAVGDPGPAPDGVRPIDAPEGTRAWVGTDPASGDTGLWVQAPTRNGGDVFALLSPTWTEAQLVDLFENGSPRPVPAVTR